MEQLISQLLARYGEKKITDWFRKVCLWEAISCMLLYGIAMVWKRYDDGLTATLFIIIIGCMHGLFFTLYLLLCLPARRIFKWDDEDFVFVLLSAFFPFATIWIDKKLACHNRE